MQASVSDGAWTSRLASAGVRSEMESYCGPRHENTELLYTKKHTPNRGHRDALVTTIRWCISAQPSGNRSPFTGILDAACSMSRRSPVVSCTFAAGDRAVRAAVPVLVFEVGGVPIGVLHHPPTRLYLIVMK